MYRGIGLVTAGAFLVACADVRVGMQRIPIGAVDSGEAILGAISTRPFLLTGRIGRGHCGFRHHLSVPEFSHRLSVGTGTIREQSSIVTHSKIALPKLLCRFRSAEQCVKSIRIAL